MIFEFYLQSGCRRFFVRIKSEIKDGTEWFGYWIYNAETEPLAISEFRGGLSSFAHATSSALDSIRFTCELATKA